MSYTARLALFLVVWAFMLISWTCAHQGKKVPPPAQPVAPVQFRAAPPTPRELLPTVALNGEVR